jgi:predicted 3-demethylubiquinone-9 3-methyltransferase (glyoxalase superfamily)
MSKIHPCLWFDDQAEEAMNYYLSIFPNSKVLAVQRNGKDGPGPEGSVLVAEFELDGMKVTALNGGPAFNFTEAVSMFVECADQKEVDHYWNSLTADGGEESMCGWLKDKYGLSWQIAPRRMLELLSDPDEGRAGRAMQAMLKMRKIVVADIEAAANG